MRTERELGDLRPVKAAVHEIANWEQQAFDRAEVALADAQRRKDERCAEIRKRLLSGYDPAGCMEEVRIDVRFKTTYRQCSLPAHPGWAFDGIVGFCLKHAGSVNADLKAVRLAEEALASARLALLTCETRDRHESEREYGVYVVYSRASGRAKIGWTGDRVSRLSNLRSASGPDLDLIAWLPTDEYDLERHLHRHFEASRIGNSEWFVASDPLAFADEAIRVAEAL